MTQGRLPAGDVCEGHGAGQLAPDAASLRDGPYTGGT